jgi:hypothetical protein
MYAAYLFSAVLGGGLLLLSLLGNLLGGDALEIEFDADADFDFDIDVDDLELGADHDVDHAASKILSIRTLTYAVSGFGAVGWLLSRMGAVPAAPSTITYAIVGGVVSGTLVNRAFGYLRRTETGRVEADDAFAGLAGRVTLPLGDGSAGKVAIKRRARRYTLRALPHASAKAGIPLSEWQNVVVVEMKNGVALVVPSDQDLTALP